MSRTLLCVVLVISSGSGGGCAYSSSLTTARTLDRGEVQVFIASEVHVAGNDAWDFPLWQLDSGIRVGVADGVEVSGRVWGAILGNYFTSLGVAVGSKIALLRTDRDTLGIDLALDPSVGYSFAQTGSAFAHVLGVSLPLLVGINTGHGDQLILGPRVMFQLLSSEGSDLVPVPSFGGSLAYAWMLGPVTIIPEVSAYYAPVRLSDADGMHIAQFAIGVVYNAKQRPE